MIEEFLDGEEASSFPWSTARIALPMATSQDHKRAGDGDTAPTPAAWVRTHLRRWSRRRACGVMREIVMPTVHGMASDGVPFTGFLYAGLMIDASGAPKVIEFNVRFGDPETQPILMRLQSDLLELVEAAIDARLHEAVARWDPRPSLGVVMAAEHYPGTATRRRSNQRLGRPDVADTKVFPCRHPAGRRQHRHRRRPRAVRMRARRLGSRTRNARPIAEVAGISWHGEFHRHDIGLAGDRARTRLTAAPLC